MNPILTSKSLTVDVHGTPVAFEDFSVYPGDFLLIKGRNGYGKSSFLKMLVGEDLSVKPVSGDLIFPFVSESKTMSAYNEKEAALLRNRIAYVPQEEDFLPAASIFSAMYGYLKLTVENRPDYSYAEKKAKKAECKQEVKNMLARFQSNGLFASSRPASFFKNPHLRSIHSCSGGQKKMVQIASALIQAKVLGAPLILMDEPLNNLDKENKKILNNEIRALLKGENPPAIMMVTHCHIFFGVNKELVLQDSDNGRKAVYTEIKEDGLFSPCLIEGNEKEGYYQI